MTGSRNNREISFKVVDRIGVIASYQNGWSKELNLICWNDGGPKFDIRDWDEEHEHMSRGITLHEGEAERLTELLMKRLGKSAPAARRNPFEEFDAAANAAEESGAAETEEAGEEEVC